MGVSLLALDEKESLSSHADSDEARSFVTLIKDSIVCIRSTSRGISFSESYGKNNDIKLRWYYNLEGRLRHLGANINGFDESINLIHIDKSSPYSRWNIALLKSSELIKVNGFMSEMDAWNLASGKYYTLPKEISLVNKGLESRDDEKKYQFIINCGHGLAHSVLEQINSGQIPEIKKEFPSQLDIWEINENEITSVSNVSRLFSTLRKCSAGMSLVYQNYIPKEDRF